MESIVQSINILLILQIVVEDRGSDGDERKSEKTSLFGDRGRRW